MFTHTHVFECATRFFGTGRSISAWQPGANRSLDRSRKRVTAICEIERELLEIAARPRKPYVSARSLCYFEGQNIEYVFRSADNNASSLPMLADIRFWRELALQCPRLGAQLELQRPLNQL